MIGAGIAVGQIIIAALALRVFAKHLAPAHALSGFGVLLTAVWGPVLLIAPLPASITFAGAGPDVPGQIMIAGPMFIAAVGIMMSAFHHHFAGADRSAALTLIGFGGLLLLIAAAGDLTVWTGQCALAIAAVMLWLHTPADAVDSSAAHAAPLTSAARMLTVFAGLCIAQGALIYLAGRALLPLTASISIITALLMIAILARRSSSSALSISIHTGIYGVLIAFACFAMRHLIGHITAGDLPGQTPAGHLVIHSLGIYTPDAAALITLGLLLTPESSPDTRESSPDTRDAQNHSHESNTPSPPQHLQLRGCIIIIAAALCIWQVVRIIAAAAAQ